MLNFQDMLILEYPFISFNPLPDKCLPNGQNICKNKGTCSIDENGAIKCECPIEYEGLHCEKGKPY